MGRTTLNIVGTNQTTIRAQVDPTISFNAGTQSAATDCDGTFATNGGEVALGAISRTAVSSSDASAVHHICTRVSTNAATGASVYVTSLNAALKSTATPGDTIPSITATPLAGATAGYGLCVGSGK